LLFRSNVPPALSPDPPEAAPLPSEARLPALPRSPKVASKTSIASNSRLQLSIRMPPPPNSPTQEHRRERILSALCPFAPPPNRTDRKSAAALRSEEHTSELQSRVDLVCRLLLEKKNNKRNNTSPTT